MEPEEQNPTFDADARQQLLEKREMVTLGLLDRMLSAALCRTVVQIRHHDEELAFNQLDQLARKFSGISWISEVIKIRAGRTGLRSRSLYGGMGGEFWGNLLAESISNDHTQLPKKGLPRMPEESWRFEQSEDNTFRDRLIMLLRMDSFEDSWVAKVESAIKNWLMRSTTDSKSQGWMETIFVSEFKKNISPAVVEAAVREYAYTQCTIMHVDDRPSYEDIPTIEVEILEQVREKVIGGGIYDIKFFDIFDTYRNEENENYIAAFNRAMSDYLVEQILSMIPDYEEIVREEIDKARTDITLLLSS